MSTVRVSLPRLSLGGTLAGTLGLDGPGADSLEARGGCGCRGGGYSTACMRNAGQRDWIGVGAVPTDGRGTLSLISTRGDGRGRGRRGRVATGKGGTLGGGITTGRNDRRRVATHRDSHRGGGGGRCTGSRAGDDRIGAAVARDGELGCLRVDYVDIGTVDGVAIII